MVNEDKDYDPYEALRDQICINMEDTKTSKKTPLKYSKNFIGLIFLFSKLCFDIWNVAWMKNTLVLV